MGRLGEPLDRLKCPEPAGTKSDVSLTRWRRE